LRRLSISLLIWRGFIQRRPDFLTVGSRRSSTLLSARRILLWRCRLLRCLRPGHCRNQEQGD
jgi:hypothetical protein